MHLTNPNLTNRSPRPPTRLVKSSMHIILMKPSQCKLMKSYYCTKQHCVFVLHQIKAIDYNIYTVQNKQVTSKSKSKHDGFSIEKKQKRQSI